ncbi:hypothetical protein LWI29_029183 [Acer saccharum]|uniref:Putative plant transposon protein domain-containing protein n=1 Tax=Acer saccharum TaxID=4024 RepID=A0AA39RIF3_ACESA|nr:hypothetical protein LWI29_029183 [Acer saccharum]
MGTVLDMGASINMMPLVLYKQLKIQSIKLTSITLTMADNTPKTPVGMVEEVYMNVHGLTVPVEFVVLDVKGGGSYSRDWKLLFGRSFRDIVGMVVDILSRNILFSCGGKSVNFKVDRSKGSQVDDCLVLEAPKLRKKRSRVLALVQAFEGVTDMKKGNHDCLNEQEAIELEEDDLAIRTFEEIGNVDFANELVIRTMDFWVAPYYSMKHTNLKLDLAFWHVFISHSLIPSKHRTLVNFNAAMVLYYILYDQLVDIGFLVEREILELGCIRVDKQSLIFPSLITNFCKEARVTWLNQLRERNLSGVRVRTGKKKLLKGQAQAEDVPEQTGVEQDYEDYIDYD